MTMSGIYANNLFHFAVKSRVKPTNITYYKFIHLTSCNKTSAIFFVVVLYFSARFLWQFCFCLMHFFVDCLSVQMRNNFFFGSSESWYGSFGNFDRKMFRYCFLCSFSMETPICFIFNMIFNKRVSSKKENFHFEDFLFSLPNRSSNF